MVALVYSTAQVLRQAHRLGTGKDLAPKQYSGIVDFAGDQVGWNSTFFAFRYMKFEHMRSGNSL